MPAPIRLMVFEGYKPGYGFYNAYGAIQRPLLRKGATGEAVKELQNLLENALQMSVGVTGLFDDRTQSAVLNFQRVKGLKVDGIVGTQTWSALLAQPVDIAGATSPSIPGTTGTDGATGSGGSVGPSFVVGDQDAALKSKQRMFMIAGLAGAGLLLWFVMGKKKSPASL
jgi:peptidoglycan hydrolase-like protein with peptidoglycan-binding domain